MSTQCVAAVKKANFMLGIIKKMTENQTANIIMPLYKNDSKATPGVLCTVLVTASQERHSGTGKGAEEID